MVQDVIIEFDISFFLVVISNSLQVAYLQCIFSKVNSDLKPACTEPLLFSKHNYLFKGDFLRGLTNCCIAAAESDWFRSSISIKLAKQFVGGLMTSIPFSPFVH